VESAITISNILYINKFDKAIFQEEVFVEFTCIVSVLGGGQN
jgi:hypothetical protein